MTALLAVDPIQGHYREECSSQQQSLRVLFEGHSIEVVPGLSHDNSVAERLPVETRAFIPWLPGARPDETITAAINLRAQGLIPVPHLAARKMKDRDSVDRLLRRLRNEAAVDQLLVIGGDVAAPEGEFDSALGLLGSGALADHGVRRVGIGGYPEGHPHISDEALLVALLEKQEYANRAGLDMFVVTQFAFSAAPVLAWLQRVRDAGLRLPVHAGVPGPARVGTLLRYGKMCGIGPSMRMLLRHGRGLASAVRVATSSGMVHDLAKYRVEHPECGLGPLHLYPFGGLERTTAWAGELCAKPR